MFQRNEFMAVLARTGKTLRDVAGALQINTATLSVKVNGHREFTRNEIEGIRQYLGLDGQDILRIFFA